MHTFLSFVPRFRHALATRALGKPISAIFRTINWLSDWRDSKGSSSVGEVGDWTDELFSGVDSFKKCVFYNMTEVDNRIVKVIEILTSDGFWWFLDVLDFIRLLNCCATWLTDAPSSGDLSSVRSSEDDDNNLKASTFDTAVLFSLVAAAI